MAAASTLEKEFKDKSKSTKNRKACEILGGILARRLKDKKIEKVVFDRGGYRYHGRVRDLAEAARKAGLDF
jgi:large subunit ribosomal protein L18